MQRYDGWRLPRDLASCAQSIPGHQRYLQAKVPGCASCSRSKARLLPFFGTTTWLPHNTHPPLYATHIPPLKRNQVLSVLPVFLRRSPLLHFDLSTSERCGVQVFHEIYEFGRCVEVIDLRPPRWALPYPLCIVWSNCTLLT